MAYDVSKQPAEWVKAQARKREREIMLLLAVAIVLVVAALFTGFGLRSSLLTLPIVVVMFILKRVVERKDRVATRWTQGASAEGAVGETLNALRQKGFTVMHDLEQAYEGNVDHLVSGPSGVYMIETKTRRYLDTDLRKATRQATKLGRQLDVWITAVICVHERENTQPFRHKHVWIVPHESLLEWISAQRNQTLPFERLARFADGL